jgi:predicted amidohydrolase
MLSPLITLLIPALLSVSEPPVVPHTLRVASVQMEVTDDLDRNLARILRGIDEARCAGARVVLFPETALSGFSKETIAALDWKRLEGAIQQVAEAVKKSDIYAFYGCATPSGAAKPYNTAILVGPDGNEVTRYHKMAPEPWFEPGDHLAYFEIDGIPCTAILCHDERFPELVRIPVLKGAEVCFYLSYEINSLPKALQKMEGYRAQLIARAVENNIWVLQSNGVGPLGETAAASLGQSRFVAPDGTVAEEAPALVDTMIVRDIEPSRASRGNALESLGVKPLGEWWRAGIAQTLPSDAAPEQATAPAKSQAKLALMRGVPVKWDLKNNFDMFLRMAAEAASKKADIFITPECWLDGYAAPDKASTVEKLRGIAQNLESSPYLQRVAAEARSRNMYICFGFTSLENGKIFNAAGLWDRTGKLIGVYHKTHMQTHDLQFSPGEALPVWDTEWGKVGIMICADRRWPETARTLRLKGARLILNPTYGMHHEKNEWWMRTRGYENQCFIAFAHPNVGFVVDPGGDIAAKEESDSPGVLLCDVDLAEARDDNHLRNRRPELYGVITEPKRPN